jgi:uncharacterized protein (DUF2384 family)
LIYLSSACHALHAATNGVINYSSNPLDEIELIQNGLNMNSVEGFRRELRWDLQSFARAIGTDPKTYNLYKTEHKCLSVTLSENAFELAHLASICINYFENIQRWNTWLNTSSLHFGSEIPLTFINSIAGRKLIKNAVHSLSYGYSA